MITEANHVCNIADYIRWYYCPESVPKWSFNVKFWTTREAQAILTLARCVGYRWKSGKVPYNSSPGNILHFNYVDKTLTWSYENEFKNNMRTIYHFKRRQI